METAVKLRHPAMFRDCLIWLVGYWDKDQAKAKLRFEGSLGEKVSMVIWHAQVELNALVTQARAAELIYTVLHHQHRKFAMPQSCSLPGYYRNLSQIASQEASGHPDTVALLDALRPLLKNNLSFDKDVWYPSETPHDDYFVCCWVADKDLPWNTEEVVS